METPEWVILGRIVRAVDAAAPDLALTFAPPPQVNILEAGRGAFPDPNRPDGYISAAVPLYLLAVFAVQPFEETESLGDIEGEHHLVVVRHFPNAEEDLTVPVPDRPNEIPALLNFGSVGLFSPSKGVYTIAELQVHDGNHQATLICFESGFQQWSSMLVECPLVHEDAARQWAYHGAVSIDSRFWWFDLSWGILSGNVDGEFNLVFHPLPDGRVLQDAHGDNEQNALQYRCITVSQKLIRYVEIIEGDGDDEAAATVHMWTIGSGPVGGQWEETYAMDFQAIWNDDSYAETGLPRNVLPVVSLVSPEDPNLVYFTLGLRLFCVNVPQHRVVQHGHEVYWLADNNAQLEAVGRFVLAWDLPPEDEEEDAAPVPDAEAMVVVFLFLELLCFRKFPRSSKFVVYLCLVLAEFRFQERIIMHALDLSACRCPSM
ncbi:hypothetical protein HU200_060093 [Digitaria exilis]|uniref:DUF1618 domain-containing protein n=1 Tax=Digitaria exilis TaxID=1010633 RepID=A0A835AFE5_9POAL|nr:hypothetical protein HU200_060093 [Digitaria exilis]